MAASTGVTRRSRVIVGVLATVVGVACERANTPPAKGTTAASATVSPSSPAADAAHATSAGTPWNDVFGAVVATPSLDDGQPISFLRDTAGSTSRAVELLGHDTTKVSAMLLPGVATASWCGWQRKATLTLADGRAAPGAWSLALSPGVATPLAVESVEEMTARDSAATVARISRVANQLPDDSTSAPYRGLPVVVRDAWRVKLADSTTVLVAIAMRSLNVESDPRAQAITLVAEPDPAAGGGRWKPVYTERVAGAEDRVEGGDLLAAFMVRGATPAVALVRDGDNGVQIEIVERVDAATWALRWSSATLPCARR